MQCSYSKCLHKAWFMYHICNTQVPFHSAVLQKNHLQLRILSLFTKPSSEQDENGGKLGLNWT